MAGERGTDWGIVRGREVDSCQLGILWTIVCWYAVFLPSSWHRYTIPAKSQVLEGEDSKSTKHPGEVTRAGSIKLA
eukprot:1920375-Amphidinium_carterae.1